MRWMLALIFSGTHDLDSQERTWSFSNDLRNSKSKLFCVDISLRLGLYVLSIAFRRFLSGFYELYTTIAACFDFAVQATQARQDGVGDTPW